MNGIIYYNYGKKMIVRLVVSISSLRKVYNGPVTILSEGNDSRKACKDIMKHFDVDVKKVNFGDVYKNKIYLNSCLSHTVTPYKNSIWIDSDTLVLKDPSKLFEYAEENEFAIAQFSNWGTKKGHISKRIKAWQDVYPDLIEPALNFGPAINCGVYAFSKDCKLVKDWFDLAVKGKEGFIPDEVCCQLMLPHYKNIIVDKKYNESCKYSKVTDETVIIHYHGRKHCRINKDKYLNHAKLWFDEFDKVKHLDVVSRNIQDDRQLRKNLERHNEINETKN